MLQLNQSNQGIILSQSMKAALKHWYRKRFIKGESTLDLMSSVHDQESRRALSIVALLDVGTMHMRGLMDAEEFQFIQVCHDYLCDGHELKN